MRNPHFAPPLCSSLARLSATATERWRPPVQPIPIVTLAFPSKRTTVAVGLSVWSSACDVDLLRLTEQLSILNML